MNHPHKPRRHPAISSHKPATPPQIPHNPATNIPPATLIPPPPTIQNVPQKPSSSRPKTRRTSRCATLPPRSCRPTRAIAIAPFSAPEDTGRVLARVREFGPDLIAVPVSFQSRAPAFSGLIRAIRATGFSGNLATRFFSSNSFKQQKGKRYYLEKIMNFQ